MSQIIPQNKKWQKDEAKKPTYLSAKSKASKF